jgi:hypothetical protein
MAQLYRYDTDIDYITAVMMGDLTVGRYQTGRERPRPYTQAL